MKKLIFLVGLGVASTFFPAVSLVYLIYLLIQWFQKNNNLFNVGAFLGIVEICGLEFWGRLTNMDPYFPYEISKYFVFLYLIVFMFRNDFKYKVFSLLLFIVCLTYSVVVILQGEKYGRVIGDANGILIILMAYTIFPVSRFQITDSQIMRLVVKWIDYILLGLIFVILKTPNIENINFQLGANYAATGGESSNQVSTYLGLGFFLTGYLMINNKSYSSNKLIDRVLLLIFVFQTILTFSRGGFIVSCILLLFVFSAMGFLKFDIKRVFLVFGVLFLLIGTFYYLNARTDGLLLKRYQGETNATMLGVKEKTLNVMSSNRLEIVSQNFEIFRQHIWGVGPSRGTQSRRESFGSDFYDHTEPSRWLIEYGIFGIILLIWFIGIFLKYVNFSFINNTSRPYSAFLLAMILLSSLTMLHSATRTFVSFLPMVVGFIKLNPNVATVNRRNKSPQKA